MAILLPLTAGGQTKEHITRVLGTRDGLSNNFIVSLDMDRRGVLWIGTEEGMDSFDGVSFRSYIRNRGEIPGNALNEVFVDRSADRVWVATQREGLGAMDLATGSPEFFFNRPGDETSIAAREITGITQDKAGNVWFSTYTKGVEKYDPATGEFSHYNAGNVAGMPEYTIISLEAGNDGKIYLGHYGSGVTVLDPESRTADWFSHSADDPDSLPSNRIGCVYKDGDNNIWIGTDRGIALYSPVTRDFKVFNQANAGVPDGLILSILVTSEGKLLVSPEYNGVWEADLGRLSGPDSFHLLPETGDIKHVGIRGMCEDAFGNLWLGTYGQGIFFLSRQRARFRSITFDGDLADQSISDLQLMPSGALIAGTQGTGVTVLDTALVRKDGGLVFTDKVVQAVTADSEGRFWIGSFSGETAVTDRNLALRAKVQVRDAKCFQERGDTMWVGAGSGLYAVRKSDYRVVARYSARDVLPENYLRALCLDDRGRLWVGTFGGGIVVLDRDMTPVVRFRTEEGFTSNLITHLVRGREGTVYAATGNGLVIFSTAGDLPSVSHIYKMEDGMSSEVIRAVSEDPSGGGVWFSTNLSICHLDVPGGALTEYVGLPGMLPGNYANHAVARRPDGILFFGSSGGLTFFDPGRVLDQAQDVSVHFTDIFVRDGSAGQEFRPVRLQSWGQTVLNYRQDTFYLKFTTDDFSYADRAEYAYRLNGKEWLPVEDNVLNFNRLRPGKYTVSIRARLQNGVWGWPASVSVRVRPPWWRSLVAKLLYLLVILYLLYQLITWLLSKANEKNQRKMEQETIARIREVNEERLRFYTNITHELKTPLTLILGTADDLSRDPQLPETARNKTSVLVKNVHRLLDLTNRLLTFRKTETHNLTLNATYGDLSDTVREIGVVFDESNTNKDTTLQIAVEPGIMTEFDRYVVTVILNNLLSNALKYTPKGSVTLRLYKSDAAGREEAVISVEDTGCGIPKDQQDKIFDRYYQVRGSHQAQGTGIGLSLVRSLVSLHHGRIELDSEVGRGSCFRVYLPVHGAAEAEEAADGQQEAPQPDRPIVVVLEDDRDIRHYVRESLEESYQVYTAKNGAEGYKLIVKHIPDLVISDVMMPEMDGYTLCTLVKNDVRTSHIPVILLTARDSMEDRSKGYQAGADSYLTKPFTSGLLLTRVRNLITAREKLTALLSDTVGEKKEFDVAQANLSRLDNEFLHHLTALIEENLSSDKLDVSFLAENMNMSVSTLYRKLKGLVGISANKYIRKIRLHKAAELLSSGGYNVSEAAWNVGINDIIYFRQSFRDEFGVAPSEYRKDRS